jgi:hypothetical protein
MVSCVIGVASIMSSGVAAADSVQVAEHRDWSVHHHASAGICTVTSMNVADMHIGISDNPRGEAMLMLDLGPFPGIAPPPDGGHYLYDLHMRVDNGPVWTFYETHLDVRTGTITFWFPADRPDFANGFIDALRRGQRVHVVDRQGEPMAGFSLAGSAAAFRSMERCLSRL